MYIKLSNYQITSVKYKENIKIISIDKVSTQNDQYSNTIRHSFLSKPYHFFHMFS